MNPCHRIGLASVTVALSALNGALGEDDPPELAGGASLRPMEPRVLHYRSRLYDDLQPFAVCATNVSDEPKPLIVDLVPGTLSRVDRVTENVRGMCEVAREHGLECVALRPCGRGNGSVYQGYGEVDVYEAIAAVRDVVSIDPQRISVTGISMGGAATWYNASHYPDFWSAAAPFCGYCDYKLWEKPGGTTFHRQPWEEFSWISRGAAYRVENFRNLPVRIVHGEWDRAVGGGVPVEHSRQMHRKLEALGITHEYIEVPATGHQCRVPPIWEETILWCLRQRRSETPEQVTLVAHTLRHHRSHWVSVEQQERSGAASRVDARRERKPRRVRVETENIRRLALGPLPDAASGGESSTTVLIDDTVLPASDLRSVRHYSKDASGSWSIASEAPAGEKRPGLSGPFGDIFQAPTVIVAGESGTPEETEYNRIMAGNAVRFYNQYNGGVHRGGITGDNVVAIPIVSDVRMAEILASPPVPADPSATLPVVHRQLLERANLFLIGGGSSNAVLARLSEALPFRFDEDGLRLAGRSYRGEHLAFYAVFPHPDGKRYVAVLAGSDPDAITWGSHIHLQLLPDFLVFRRGEALDWGFWSNEWRA